MVSALAAVLIGFTGCSGADEGGVPAATSAPAVAADEAFAAATEALTTRPLQFSMEVRGQFSVNGWMDVTNRTAEVMGSLPIGGKSTGVHLIAVGDDVWLKLSGDPRLTKWLHTTTAQVAGSTFDLTAPGNPGGLLGLVNAVTRVESAGPGKFQGTVDMTTSPTYDPAKVGALADKLRAVPFQAKTDAEGHLSTFQVDLTGFAPNMVMSASYTYGVPVVVTPPPAADVMEMPAAMVAGIRS